MTSWSPSRAKGAACDLDGLRTLASDWIQIIRAAATDEAAGSEQTASPR